MGRKQNESAFTRWFCREIQRVNGVTLAIVASAMQRSGLPDRYVCHKKFRGWLEFKKDDGRLSTAQRITLNKLEANGDTCLVVRYRYNDMLEIETVNGRTLLVANLVPLYTKSTPGTQLLEFLQQALVAKPSYN